MKVLVGTTKDPNPKKFVPAEEANRIRVEEAFDEMTDRAESYQKYLQTSAGQAASQLADKQIAYLYSMLALPLKDFCTSAQVSVEMADETRAEMRGELRVWKLLKSEPERLERLINIRKEEVQDSEKGRSRWRSLLSRT